MRSGSCTMTDVVQRPDRKVGVADHVLEQHHPRQRRRVEIRELDARQLDDAAAEAAGDFVFVLDEDRRSASRRCFFVVAST